MAPLIGGISTRQRPERDGPLMTQVGMYSTTTPRNDASPGRGQWQLDNAYRYLSEAYGGYHWDYAAAPFVTFRAEYNYREANVPYFSGPGGVTPPGGNQGAPGSVVANWAPDLVEVERRLTFAMLVKL